MMTLLNSYTNKAQNLLGTTFEGITLGKRQLFTASTDYAVNLAGIVFSDTKYPDPGAYAYSKLLGWSKFLSSYTTVIETLDNLSIEMDLEEFQGEF